MLRRFEDALSILFLISGCAALIYQIVWQRKLFGVFGVNIESITVVVAVFMLGLGLGAMLGGRLSRRFPDHLPWLFLVFELAIGAFGFASLSLLDVVGRLALDASLGATTLAVFAFLALPTVLMGATLPVLVAQLCRVRPNLGSSVGQLYSVNTLGSALACFLTADLLFPTLGLSGSVQVAATLNVSVGAILFVLMRGHASPSRPRKDAAPSAFEEPAATRFRRAVVLSGVVAFAALSQEILWMRAVGYATGSRPRDFAHVLGMFLLGVALASWWAKRACERGDRHPLEHAGRLLTVGAGLYFVSIPIAATAFVFGDELGLPIIYLEVSVIAFLLGAVFPLCCHYGGSVSWIYLANIVGSAAAPLITGFVVLDHLALDEAIAAVSLLTLAAGLVAWGWQASAARRRWVGGALLAAIALAALYRPLWDGYLEKLHFKGERDRSPGYAAVIENRTGIVAVGDDEPATVYGGGVYDGRFNVDPMNDANGIRRAYMTAAIRPELGDVLVVGLSTGSWARVVTSHTSLQSMTIVEINPGYLELRDRHPALGEVADDPRVDLHIDDGRRWLLRNPDRKFDIILMNTTFHWRSYAANLLSRDFLQVCRAHLKPGGLLYYNATGSASVRHTAATVFDHVAIYGSFVAASDSPIDSDPATRRHGLLGFEANGRPIFDESDPAAAQVLRQLLDADLTNRHDELLATPGAKQITDDNMANEY